MKQQVSSSGAPQLAPIAQPKISTKDQTPLASPTSDSQCMPMSGNGSQNLETNRAWTQNNPTHQRRDEMMKMPAMMERLPTPK